MTKKIIYDLKFQVEEKFVLPVAKKININPNFITLGSILLMGVAAFYVLQKNLVLSALFVFFSSYFDMLDGTVARLKKGTKFGAFIDRMSDRINDSIIIFSIIAAGYVEVLFGIVALISVLLASYVSSVYETFTKSKVGETLSLRGIRLLIIIFGFLFSAPYTVISLMLVIGFYSLIERLHKAWVDLK